MRRKLLPQIATIHPAKRKKIQVFDQMEEMETTLSLYLFASSVQLATITFVDLNNLLPVAEVTASYLLQLEPQQNSVTVVHNERTKTWLAFVNQLQKLLEDIDCWVHHREEWMAQQ